jgi:hypothetical protein
MFKKVLAISLAITAIAIPGASAQDSGNTTNPNKAAYQSAKASFRTAVEAYKVQKADTKAARDAAKASAKTAIDAAKATYEGVKSGTPTPENLAAAKSAFDSAKESAKASIPSKPVKPTKPVKPAKSN